MKDYIVKLDLLLLILEKLQWLISKHECKSTKINLQVYVGNGIWCKEAKWQLLYYDKPETIPRLLASVIWISYDLINRSFKPKAAKPVGERSPVKRLEIDKLQLLISNTLFFYAFLSYLSC